MVHIARKFKKNHGYSLITSFSILILLATTSGCVVKEMGTAIKHNITGEHYLSTEDYSRGADKFRQEVTENPNSALANYYYGRFLLSDKKSKEALRYLQKASKLKPNDPDYYFWVGVAQGNLGNKTLEKKSYQKALSLKEDHLQSLIYLGHLQLESKKYSQALDNYSKALEQKPESPSPLYNRALILTKLGRKPEALEGWLEYLSYYPSGAMARQAVVHLNRLDNFSFRNYQFLSRTVTVEKIYFEPFTSRIEKGSRPSLELIGAVFKNMKKGKLQVVVYQLKNKELAKQKALRIRDFLLQKYPEIKKTAIGLSWFSSPESIKVSKRNKKINDSVKFFISR
jgi:tetratricopeptide (TPR) repeat protein